MLKRLTCISLFCLRSCVSRSWPLNLWSKSSTPAVAAEAFAESDELAESWRPTPNQLGYAWAQACFELLIIELCRIIKIAQWSMFIDMWGLMVGIWDVYLFLVVQKYLIVDMNHCDDYTNSCWLIFILIQWLWKTMSLYVHGPAARMNAPKGGIN